MGFPPNWPQDSFYRFSALIRYQRPMHSFKTILLSLCLLATALAQEVLPPTPLKTPWFELSAAYGEDGGVPTSYQWYRGSKSNPLAVPILGPEGTQQTITLRPPLVSGWYVCVMKNEAGSCMTQQTQVSITKTLSAPSMQITVKQP